MILERLIFGFHEDLGVLRDHFASLGCSISTRAFKARRKRDDVWVEHFLEGPGMGTKGCIDLTIRVHGRPVSLTVGS